MQTMETIGAPQYKCHKVVRALPIYDIGEVDPMGLVVISTATHGDVVVPMSWVEKHNPEVGGYIVRYEDGYVSYSPQKAFEDGYAPVKPEPVPGIPADPGSEEPIPL